jgi:hypothetical protein
MFNFGMAYAFNGNKCVSCSDENMELIEAMGFEVETVGSNLVITNSITGEVQRIDLDRNQGLCNAYKFCVWFAFWIAYGIFFLPCLIGVAGAC